MSEIRKFSAIYEGNFVETNPNEDYYDSLIIDNRFLININPSGSFRLERSKLLIDSYYRILSSIKQFSLHISDLRTVGDVPFCIYCKDSKYDIILSEIRKYLECNTDRNHPQNHYSLKSSSMCHMEYNFIENDEFSTIVATLDDLTYFRSMNFWWCIDDTDTGDWIAFTGCGARQRSVLSCIEKDHEKYINH